MYCSCKISVPVPSAYGFRVFGWLKLASKPLAMHPQIDTLPDSLLANCELPRRARFYPLGFPLELETNSQEVIQAAAEGWGRFAPRFDETPLRIRLGVSEREEMPLPSEPRIDTPEHLITFVWDQSNFAVCDMRSGFSFGWVTRKVARDHAFLRYHFLQALAMGMLVHRSLAPVHGAFVARKGRGVLLCGDSFAGKTTLAYACARAGWTYLADDGTFLIRARQDRYAATNPYHIHFRSDAPALFPELRGRANAVRPNGKVGIEVFTSDLPIAVAGECSIDHVVFLNRGEIGRAHLAPHSEDDAMAWCEQRITYGEARVRTEQRQTLRKLLGAGVWKMRYSDLPGAVDCLERLVESGGSVAQMAGAKIVQIKGGSRGRSV